MAAEGGHIGNAAGAARSGAPLLHLAAVGMRFAGGNARHAEVEALAGFNLTVEAGELLSLVGPSGCGKSTVLRLIAGLLRPTAGTIERRLSDPQAVGFVFQEPTLMPWATVAGNVELPLRLLGLPRGEVRRRAGEAVERLGLADFAGAYPRQLSGGMRMRAAIARALAPRPRLLLMDEPFAALDEITRWKLNDDLLALWREEDLTVVFVTHSVYESAYLSTRIAILSARPGRLVGEVLAPISPAPPTAPVSPASPTAPASPASPAAPTLPDDPRTPAYRDSAAYRETCRAVSALLAAAGHHEAKPASEGPRPGSSRPRRSP